MNNQWTQIDFQQKYDSPKFIAEMQSFHGEDPANLRYRNLTQSGVEVRIEEEQSADKETWHAVEAIGYAVFET